MLVVLALFAPGLAACATQQAMTVASGAVANPSPKYRNAIAVRSVSGGQVMNILTVPGVANEPLKAALEGGIEGRPENVLFYATSNRRHLMPRDLVDNERGTAINPGEAVEEKVSLSDRFGQLGRHRPDPPRRRPGQELARQGDDDRLAHPPAKADPLVEPQAERRARLVLQP